MKELFLSLWVSISTLAKSKSRLDSINRHPLFFIIRLTFKIWLLLSVSLCPKAITLSGFPTMKLNRKFKNSVHLPIAQGLGGRAKGPSFGLTFLKTFLLFCLNDDLSESVNSVCWIVNRILFRFVTWTSNLKLRSLWFVVLGQGSKCSLLPD